MKRLIVILLLLKFSFASFSSTKKDSLLNQLKFEMNRKAIYDGQKLSRIKAIESALSKNKGNRYHQLTRLFDEYEYFKFDSAYLYGKKLLEISTEMQDQVKLAQSKVKIASLLLHAGMFKETFDYLAQIDESKLDRKYKYDLYCLKSGAYSNLAIYNNDPNFTPHYNRKAIEYLDSAKAVCQPNSLDLLFTLGNRQVVAGDINKQPTYFLQILKNHQLTAHNRARLLTALAAFYQDKTENVSEFAFWPNLRFLIFAHRPEKHWPHSCWLKIYSKTGTSRMLIFLSSNQETTPDFMETAFANSKSNRSCQISLHVLI